MTRREQPKSSAIESLAAVGPYLGHGLTLAMATGLFFLVGWWIDGRLGTTPIFSILGALVGAAGGFYYLIRHLIEGGASSGGSVNRRPEDGPGGVEGE